MSFSAKNLVLVRNGKRVLDDVSADVPDGKLIVVLGQNGAGKSTLMNALAGGIVPESGEIFCNGIPLKSFSSRELARRRAVLTQATHSVFDFTAEETVLLGRAPWIDAAETRSDREIASETLRVVGLAGFEKRRLSTLSGGELQRVQIARTFAQGITPTGTPTAFFLDEPLAALDFRHRFEIMHCLHALARAGNAVFAVLHDLNLAIRFADGVLVMDSGKIVLTGTPREVFTPANLAEIFGIRAEIFQRGNDAFVCIAGTR